MSRPRVKQRFGSARDAATRSGLSVRTIRRLIARGELKASRVGRRVLVDLAELDRYIKLRTAPPPAYVKGLAGDAIVDVEGFLAGEVRKLIDTSPEPHGDDTWEVPI